MVIQLRFGQKMQLPAYIEVRHRGPDNFLFVAGGCQSDYDEYYASVANDSCHQEISAGAARSPISKRQSAHLIAALAGFFAVPRNVLDFGCVEGSLLVELATNFPSSTFRIRARPGRADGIEQGKDASPGQHVYCEPRGEQEVRDL